MQGFWGEVVRGLAKPKFKSFVQRAVAEAPSLPTAQQGSLVELVELDCLEELGPATLQERVQNFTEADLVFLDMPKVLGKYQPYMTRP